MKHLKVIVWAAIGAIAGAAIMVLAVRWGFVAGTSIGTATTNAPSQALITLQAFRGALWRGILGAFMSTITSGRNCKDSK